MQKRLWEMPPLRERPLNRRHFLGAAAGAAGGGAFSHMAIARAANFRGIYPIAWTPCTPDGAFDAAGMGAHVAFCRRGGVAGLVWPQNSSAWSTRSEEH